MNYSQQKYKYLYLLSEKYPTIQEVYAEIIHLQAILDLPKGTEHFMSDLHGEYEAFYHILNNCSGVIREKVDFLFARTLTAEQCAEFCTLIYYPKEKLETLQEKEFLTTEWYEITIYRLIKLAKFVASKYTRSKVRKAMPKVYRYILDELLHAQPKEHVNQLSYHKKIVDTLISIKSANDFIIAFSKMIKRLAVDHLHIVGDIFDRGMRPDAIIDMLIEHHSLDIEWGNHDILWMGAAAGSEACIATVIRNSLSYRNMDVLEKGYAISLRPLSLFAAKIYPDENSISASKKAISMILFKLEGQLIYRNPEFKMEDRLLLHKIDRNTSSITIDGKILPLKSAYFPTLSQLSPYILTEEEAQIMRDLRITFQESEKLHKHIRFLYKKGSMYRCYNQNLLFHGCIPLDENGDFANITFDGKTYFGKSYMDYADKKAREAYFGIKQQKNLDFMWYLWCGSKSPLSGRKIKTFERDIVDDPFSWAEPKNPYYHYSNSEKTCDMILKEFNLSTKRGHIINGHVPVKVINGENPVRGNGKAIVIDGGFCRAYQKTTGIAGYTLIYNSYGLRLMSHQPFSNSQKSLEKNEDIESKSKIIEQMQTRIMVNDTDLGEEIKIQLSDLEELLNAYKTGVLTPQE